MKIVVKNELVKSPASLTFLGQAGFIFESSTGATLALDPYLSNCCEGLYGYKRILPYLVEPENFDVDSVLITHEHEDHMDVEALPVIGAKFKPYFFAGPRAYDWLFENLSDAKLEKMERGKLVQFLDYAIIPVPADHGYATPDALGYIIEMDKIRILSTGDTSLRLDFVEQYSSRGSIDILILPINGKFGNLDTEDAATLTEILNPSMVIPTHIWNFIEHGGNYEEFILRTRSSKTKAEVYPMRPGETLKFEDVLHHG